MANSEELSLAFEIQTSFNPFSIARFAIQLDSDPCRSAPQEGFPGCHGMGAFLRTFMPPCQQRCRRAQGRCTRRTDAFTDEHAAKGQAPESVARDESHTSPPPPPEPVSLATPDTPSEEVDGWVAMEREPEPAEECSSAAAAARATAAEASAAATSAPFCRTAPSTAAPGHRSPMPRRAWSSASEHPQNAWAKQVQVLREMGFPQTSEELSGLLERHAGVIQGVLAELFRP